MKGPVCSSLLAGIVSQPDRTVTFRFEGRMIEAVVGQSIAAALFAAGVRIFSRSFKYHRPRGLFCCSGDCPNCLMQVDGKPNVRTCVEPVRDGQIVRRQNAWPSANFDVLRIFDKLDRLLPVGFYYRRFHKPRWLWPVFEHIVRHIAGLGRIDVRAVPEVLSEVESEHADVCVVGAGPSGLAAAETAADAGANVLLLERMPQLGGHLLYLSNNEVETRGEAVSRHPRIRVLRETTAFGVYEGNLLGAIRANTFLKIRAKQLIVCTGGREQPFVFQNNDLPGVFLSRGAIRLARLYGVLAGTRAVVFTNHDEGFHQARRFQKLGIDVAAVIDSRPSSGVPGGEFRAETSTRVYHRAVITEARGGGHLEAVRVARTQHDGTVDRQSVEEIECDLLCFASELVPANELLLQAGVRFRFDAGRWVLNSTPRGISGAGAAAGTLHVPAQILEGRLCGAQAAAALGYTSPPIDQLQHELASSRGPTQSSDRQARCPPASERHRKRFICLCEDVTEKDLDQAIAEGFDNIETLKRYSTVNMGPCQGKMCGPLAAHVCASATGRDLNAVGTTTSRPPAIPIELSVLAAASHHPVRRTPLHQWHESAGARWMDAGQWKRPETYGDPIAEVRAVRSNAGLIDVSTLGKIELVGPDTVELLNRVYLNKWADLRIGRARYGVMCNEDGIIFDDGVCARIDSERFYLTATTGNSEAVLQWLELWRATWRLDVTVLSHTSGMAAMNLAGPRSREILGRLTSLDLTNTACPYMSCRDAAVADVPCRLLRIGFVGELGYEIHCPSAYARHLWEAILEAGREFELRAFGVEAQRILRLEKGHVIIGADTDALSNPLEAGLEWLVRLDKPQFVGREPLVRLKAIGPRSQLVGFVLNDERGMMDDKRGQRSEGRSQRSADSAPSSFINQHSSFRVSTMEGCQVVERGRSVGRITSARFSPTLDRNLGLAWVPPQSAAVGTEFFIRWNGTDLSAVVTSLPFYDAAGTRLKM